LNTSKVTGLTQAEAAALCQVDRTTIRAWQQAGMPYTQPDGPGKAGSYDARVLLHWALWIDLKGKLGPDAKMDPARAIAYVHAAMGDDSWEGEDVYASQVHGILRGYFSREQIDRAIGYALALTSKRAA
jgi:hypothetical protein